MKTTEQAHALEESRAKWAADVGAREATLKQKEEAANASARRQQEGLRKRAAQDEQVHTCDVLGLLACSQSTHSL